MDKDSRDHVVRKRGVEIRFSDNVIGKGNGENVLATTWLGKEMTEESLRFIDHEVGNGGDERSFSDQMLTKGGAETYFGGHVVRKEVMGNFFCIYVVRRRGYLSFLFLSLDTKIGNKGDDER
jgi:hypothetical protein